MDWSWLVRAYRRAESGEWRVDEEGRTVTETG